MLLVLDLKRMLLVQVEECTMKQFFHGLALSESSAIYLAEHVEVSFQRCWSFGLEDLVIEVSAVALQLEAVMLLGC